MMACATGGMGVHCPLGSQRDGCVDAILRLIEDIYEAGAHPEHWDATLNHIADVTGSGDVTMGSQTPSQVKIVLSARTDPDYVRTYSEYYRTRNPMQMASHVQPVGRAVLDAMIMDVERFQAGEFFNDWCLPQGFLTGGSINLAASAGWRATVMFSGSGDYNAEKLKLLDAVAPHLCRAFQLNQVLHETQALGLSAMAALEHVEKGAFTVDRRGRARAANAVAQRILALNDGLFLRDGRLSAALSAETAAIDRAIANCGRGVVEASGATLSVTRSAGRSQLSLLCIPFPAPPSWPGFERQTALIFVTDHDARLEQQTRRLRDRYGLTPAEAALAWEIVRTGGRQSAAANRGTSVATARSQLTAIFDKTGVRRQAELVRLLLEDESDAS